MKKCLFCGEEIPETNAVCPWCGRRQQQQQKSSVETQESPIKVELDYSSGSPIKIKSDFSGLKEAMKRVEYFLADLPEETEVVRGELSQEQLIEWDARDEKARESFRHSYRELCRKMAEAKHLPARVVSEDGSMLSICKFDKAGTWQFIDLEGFARIPDLF